ncbi:hypothetical protein Tco_0756397, partial [Tanacetum coccineum]
FPFNLCPQGLLVNFLYFVYYTYIIYDDPFDSKEDKIKESKLLIDELDPPRSSDFLPSPKCDSVLYEDFSEVDALPSTDNEDKIFNPGILIHENHFEVTNCEKNVKKTTNASLILEDFNPPLYELPFHKEVPGIASDFETSRAHGLFPSGSDDTDFDPEGDLRLIEELLNNDPSSPLPLSHNPLSGSTTSSSPDHLLEEFADELALITFPPGNDDFPFDIKSDLREIEYLLNHDPTKEIDFILKDSLDEDNLADPNNDLVDTIPEMFTDEPTLDYSSPPLYDDVDDCLVELESDNDDVYDDPFDSKEDKIKESKLLIDELDFPRSSDFLPSPKYDSVLYEDFSEVDALPSTNKEDKVFNPGILIHENLFEVTIRVTPDKNEKKISISNASLILEDFNPPLYELPFHKEVPGSETLLSFSSENEEKVFNPGILTSKEVHTSLLPKLSHRGPKAFNVIKIFEKPDGDFSLLL